ncbi:LysR family transcriptional regulator [Psychrosphaera haliotis]|uniref:LysR family transcriptional regulator n=1 Tax=Psychrosphaera haliotis TaxID=555083 RepID=A0A6N8F4L1_9GAMM|nr:LysR family transcriptional regulator [Psychrosphaera haliotis]MUH71084.1 LysR family transcriptional regulator [Psychrosphaera haliotis]
MDLASKLLLLLDVAELGTFAKASEHRHVDRSVISKQIAKLEQELGVRVLNRTTRSLSLTAAGTEIVQQAKLLRELLNETKRRAQNYHSEPQGRLKITSSTHFGRRYVQKAVIEFQRRFPQIDVELRLEDRLVDIVGEGYDIGFRFGEPKDSSLIARKLARNRLAIVASESFFKRYKKPETIQDLKTLPCAIYSSSGFEVDRVNVLNELGLEESIKLNAAYRVNDVEMLVRTAESGNMFAVVAAQMLENEVISGALIPVMTDLTLLDFGALYAVYPHRDSPVKTRLFIDTIKELIGSNIPDWESCIPGFDAMYGHKKEATGFEI